jgi:hypothetical protein
MRLARPFLLAALLVSTGSVNATSRQFPTCAAFAAFLQDQINLLDHRIAAESDPTQFSLVAQRNHYRTELSAIQAGQFKEISTRGAAERHEADLSGSRTTACTRLHRVVSPS